MSTFQLFRLCCQRAEPGCQLGKSRVLGVFHNPSPVALGFELPLPLAKTRKGPTGSSCRAQCCCFHTSPMQEQQAHSRSLTWGGWRELLYLLGEPEGWLAAQCLQPWQQQQQPHTSEPVLETPLWVMHIFFRLRAPWNWALHTSACLLLSRLCWVERKKSLGGEGEDTPKLLGALTHSSSRRKFCLSVLWVCSCVHGAVPGPWLSLIRAGLHCCSVLLSVRKCS